MRRRSAALMALFLLLPAGCGGGDESGPRGGGPGPRLPPHVLLAAATTEPAVRGPVYLDRDDCVRQAKVGGGTGYPEVDCADPRAYAKVLSRYLVERVPQLTASECHDDTDLIVDMRESLRLLGTYGGDEGYACLRLRKPPHPSDPGRGGGPRARVGDCVTVSGDDSGVITRLVMGNEVPCAKAKRGSTYRVVKLVTAPRIKGPKCPGSSEQFTPTSLLGGSTDPLEQVEFVCAKKL